MLYNCSRLSDRTALVKRRTDPTAVLTAAALACFLAGTLATPVLAQGDSIGVTYQSATGGEKDVSGPVDPETGIAEVSVPDAEYSADSPDRASLDDGSAFVVTPTIDPELYLFYKLTNLSGKPLTVLSFTLQEADGFYFDGKRPLAFPPRAFEFRYNFADEINDGDPNTEIYRTLTFTYNGSGEGLTQADGAREFSFAITVPATMGQDLGVQLRPEGGQILPFDLTRATAPEPGSASLLTLAGLVSLPIAGLRIRRRRLSQSGNTT